MPEHHLQRAGRAGTRRTTLRAARISVLHQGPRRDVRRAGRLDAGARRRLPLHDGGPGRRARRHDGAVAADPGGRQRVIAGLGHPAAVGRCARHLPAHPPRGVGRQPGGGVHAAGPLVPPRGVLLAAAGRTKCRRVIARTARSGRRHRGSTAAARPGPQRTGIRRTGRVAGVAGGSPGRVAADLPRCRGCVGGTVFPRAALGGVVRCEPGRHAASPGGQRLMWRIRTVHTTGYAYTAPVTVSYNEVRLSPRSDPRQTVVVNRVETLPATRSYRYLDYWGSVVTAFDLHVPHTKLEVTSYSVVETKRPEPPAVRATWADLTAESVTDRFGEVLDPTGYTPASKRVAAVGRRIAKYHQPADAVVAAAQWVRSELTYIPGGTDVHSSGLDALREGSGVCQDFAHLCLIVLRSMGIPGRYAWGYLHPKPDAAVGDTVVGQTHAWIQAWTGSWWSYDPTNDSEINEQYVSVVVGRDYADVPPLKGIYSGDGAVALTATVEITRLA